MLSRWIRLTVVAGLYCGIGGAMARGDDNSASELRGKVDRAIERGLAIVQKGARNYPANRECFSCHHQALPLLAMTSARDSGIVIENDLAASVVEFTQDSFRDEIDELRQGRGIGGKGLTVGYGLWTIELGRAPKDELTEAMVTYLIKAQAADGHWDLGALRPPAEESYVIATVLAARGIRNFATLAQRDEAAAALAKAGDWLAKARLDLHEDRVALAWEMRLSGEGKTGDATRAVARLRDSQRADGGWSQTAELESDAYATGTALYALLATGPARKSVRKERGNGGDAAGLDAESPANETSNRRAVDWLLAHQLADGSWHVKTRARPVQVYFDNGDPHGKDQFISISASAWAVAALSSWRSALASTD